MVGVGWILASILGGLAGWIAEKVIHSNMGLLMNIVLGIVGAVVGNFLLTLIFGATAGGILGQLIVAVESLMLAGRRQKSAGLGWLERRASRLGSTHGIGRADGLAAGQV